MRKPNIKDATQLIDEAMSRISKRTKTYKLLVRARSALCPPVSVADIDTIFKRVYASPEKINATSAFARAMMKATK